MKGRVRRRSYSRVGRLVPAGAAHFRGRSMRLLPGQGVEWHSTGRREEVLLAMTGTLWLEYEQPAHRVRNLKLSAGECVFLPQAVRHRVINRSLRTTRYLYLTAG